MITHNINTDKIIERNLFFNKQVDQTSIGDIIKEIININSKDLEYEKLAVLNRTTYDRQPININLKNVSNPSNRYFYMFCLDSMV